MKKFMFLGAIVFIALVTLFNTSCQKENVSNPLLSENNIAATLREGDVVVGSIEGTFLYKMRVTVECVNPMDPHSVGDWFLTFPGLHFFDNGNAIQYSNPFTFVNPGIGVPTILKGANGNELLFIKNNATQSPSPFWGLRMEHSIANSFGQVSQFKAVVKIEVLEPNTNTVEATEFIKLFFDNNGSCDLVDLTDDTFAQSNLSVTGNTQINTRAIARKNTIQQNTLFKDCDPFNCDGPLYGGVR